MSVTQPGAAVPATIESPARTVRRRPKITIGRVGAAVGIAIALLWTLLPIYWMLATSFKTPLEATALAPTGYPNSPTVDNYTGLWSGSLPFATFLLNSVVTSLASAIISVALSATAAYSLSRARWKLRSTTSFVILAVRMLPLVVLIGPLYLLLLHTHLLNSYVGLVLGYTTFGLPFATWMLKGFMDGVPREIEEAARVDGYPRYQILLRVVLPLILPGLFTTATFVFMDSWNNLIYPLTLITDVSKQTLPGGLLESFTGQYKTDWGGMTAASTITTIPVMVGFFLVQRSMVRGLTAGALAGE